MLLAENQHLTYCTNIHPGESWEETFEQLRKYLPAVKKRVAGEEPMGVGLRLSNAASRELSGKNMEAFREWLDGQGLYVFTMNGFPYGKFHGEKVKDLVHYPDWRTGERVDYTLRLFEQLSELLPAETEGGISTAPLSYKHWFANPTKITQALVRATYHVLMVAEKLAEIRESTGQMLHLDIEPEPDGLLGNTREFIQWYEEYLLPEGVKFFSARSGVRQSQSEQLIRDHIRLCYDVCHVSVAYEDHLDMLNLLLEKGIGIGKLQLSAAMKAVFEENNNLIINDLERFNEPVYLHQVIARMQDGGYRDFYDLPTALKHFSPDHREWRVHFHVPLFVRDFGNLQSTQPDVIKVLNEYAARPFSPHLEVETYTWEVLPGELRTNLGDSIARELEWTKQFLVTTR